MIQFAFATDPVWTNLTQTLNNHLQYQEKITEDIAKTEELLISLHKQLKKAKDLCSKLETHLTAREQELKSVFFM
jgi:hypothetical protein